MNDHNEIQSALSFVPSHDRETWVRMAMAVKSELGDNGHDIWDEWSRTDKSYHKMSALSVWKGVKPGGKVTVRTLFHEAMQNGWKPSKPYTPPTPEQRAELEAERIAAEKAHAEIVKRQHKDAADKANIIWDAAAECVSHPYLTRKAVKSHGLRVGRWTREDRDGNLWLDIPDALLIPIKDGKKIVSIQAIFSDKNNPAKRDKDFLTGGKKRGCFFAIGQPVEINGDTKIIICEGYATGATIHEATGCAVIVAFDAGNLESVAVRVRKGYPHAEIIIAADNDQFTEGNPGIKYANVAAKSAGGFVIIPDFDDLINNPTDFNDYAATNGIDAVAKKINNVREDAEKSVIESLSSGDIANREMPEFIDSEFTITESSHITQPNIIDLETGEITTVDQESELPQREKIKLFSILGYDQDQFFAFPHSSRQLTVLTKSDLTENGLLSLAPLLYWERTYPAAGKTSKFDKSRAVDDLIYSFRARGIFDPSKVRGRGAWRDGGRIVFHLGDRLIVDGVGMELEAISSKYIYQADRQYPDFEKYEPLSSDEGESLIDLASRFRWRIPASAALLVGWCVLAPVCGALRWRPHIWLTGGAGSGKSTVLEEFIHKIVGAMSVYAQGSSTEAGLRQTIGGDAVPVLFDESEQNNEREANRMQNVISLVRQSSSESHAMTFKGTVSGKSMQFHIRSMFCLASIQVGLQFQADRERLTVLSLQEKTTRRSGDKKAADEQWQAIKDGLYNTFRDGDFSLRLLKRTTGMMPIVLASIDVFIKAAAKHFGNQRTGDQYGTLLAGAWCLTSSRVPSEYEALEWISGYQWDELIDMDADNEDEASRAAQFLLDNKLRAVTGDEYTIYELLDKIAYTINAHRKNEGDPVCRLEKHVAISTLNRYGMGVSNSGGEHSLVISKTSDSFTGLFAGTKYAADLIGVLSRLPFAVKDRPTFKINGKTCRGVVLNFDGLV